MAKKKSGKSSGSGLLTDDGVPAVLQAKPSQNETIGKCRQRQKKEKALLDDSVQQFLQQRGKSPENEELVARWHEQLAKKHRDEIAAIEGDDADSMEALVAAMNVSQAPRAPTKAELRRKQRDDEFQAAKLEHEARVVANGGRLAEIEAADVRARIPAGMRVVNVPPDGSCLFHALSLQLDNISYQDLRVKAVNELRAHSSDYRCFCEGVESDSDWEQYLDGMLTDSWGGAPELMALSRVLQCPIAVYKADAEEPVVFGEDLGREPLRVAFYQHMYDTGEHYNAVL